MSKIRWRINSCCGSNTASASSARSAGQTGITHKYVTTHTHTHTRRITRSSMLVVREVHCETSGRSPAVRMDQQTVEILLLGYMVDSVEVCQLE